MSTSGEQTARPSAQPLTPRQRGRRLLLLGGMAPALTLTLGISLFLGAIPGASQVLAASQRPTRMPTMMPGQCGGQCTVSKVSGQTITVTRSGGSTVTIHAGSRTHYTESGHPVSASTVRVGSTIYVVGTCTDHGRTITATSIEIIR